MASADETPAYVEHARMLAKVSADHHQKELARMIEIIGSGPASTELTAPTQPKPQKEPCEYYRNETKNMIVAAFFEVPRATAQDIRRMLVEKGVPDALKVSKSTISKVKRDMKDRRIFPKF